MRAECWWQDTSKMIKSLNSQAHLNLFNRRAYYVIRL